MLPVRFTLEPPPAARLHSWRSTLLARPQFIGRIGLALCAAVLLSALPWRTQAAGLTVTRATLSNGLRVIVVRNPLAPVVTTVLNYEAGSDDQFVAGLAHATEHMMFRGSKTVSSSQLMDTIDVTGGDFDADTQNEITQYYFTVPSQYLDIALRLERSRASGLLMSQSLWNKERGAITQEVTQDNSNAVYRLFVKMQDRLLAGTPYDKNGLGTVHDFAVNVNSPQLLKFYGTWYHPNNAIYVIVGDVDPKATIGAVKKYFGKIPSATSTARRRSRRSGRFSGTFRPASSRRATPCISSRSKPRSITTTAIFPSPSCCSDTACRGTTVRTTPQRAFSTTC